jgi:hypothetical protein
LCAEKAAPVVTNQCSPDGEGGKGLSTIAGVERSIMVFRTYAAHLIQYWCNNDPCAGEKMVVETITHRSLFVVVAEVVVPKGPSAWVIVRS